MNAVKNDKQIELFDGKLDSGRILLDETCRPSRLLTSQQPTV